MSVIKTHVDVRIHIFLKGVLPKLSLRNTSLIYHRILLFSSLQLTLVQKVSKQDAETVVPTLPWIQAAVW